MIVCVVALLVVFQPGRADQVIDVPATMTIVAELDPVEDQVEPLVTETWLDAPGIPQVIPTNLLAPAGTPTFTLEDVRLLRLTLGQVHADGPTTPISMEC